VYACDFFSDESHIVTGSRDKKIRIYTVPKLDLVGEFNVGIAVSAVSTLMVKDQRIIVAGLETGQIYIYRMSADYALHEIGSIERSLIPNGQINRILTRGDGNFMVACCSDDHTVRIYDVQLI
jgi:WD40 repeat protein